MTDLVLAIAHHLCVFTLAGLLLAEVVLLRPDLSPARILQLGRIDIAYGIVAGLVVVVGVLRVNFGDKGADYYLHNWAFWLKMSAFVLLGLLSIPPTLAIIAPDSVPHAPGSDRGRMVAGRGEDVDEADRDDAAEPERRNR